MNCYRIEITKTLGGEVVDMPIISAESKQDALNRFEDLVLDEYNELNQPMMRNIGGTSELFLTKSDNILLRGEIIKHVTVKRPLHSPSASVFRRVEDENE